MKKILIIFVISVLAIACGGQKTETTTANDAANNAEAATLTIDFQAIIGDTNNTTISSNSYLKITGSYGDIDGKIDAATGASVPTRTPDLLNKYRSADNNVLNNRIEVSMGQFLLFGTANSSRYIDDGMSGSGIAQRTVDGTTGPKVTGTGITKGDDGVITIRFVHAGGKTVDPYVFEMKSDANGVFQIGAGTENFKRSETALTNDFDFNTDSALLIVDKAKEGNPYWKGDLQATFENNIIKLNGTLTEVK
ncbi:hypothetical protein [Brachyspira hampsonii]|uniref:Lipoprotein n=1 Tax=Brachyspira hampsonii 30446 TaxID=1289135 RepID=A0A2U4F6F0_9SPIR|nr:hypothetical protein [Brachyspira hampsonii]EKV56670.1 hypothetical protein A966_08999 [Brachyspira hampsonii 30446]MBW5390457.1 hypothetical protein [Brachyspira hampsonii]OEJ20375.1 hypothetical protein A9495_12280 [Brachyspira hampsonii]